MSPFKTCVKDTPFVPQNHISTVDRTLPTEQTPRFPRFPAHCYLRHGAYSILFVYSIPRTTTHRPPHQYMQ